MKKSLWYRLFGWGAIPKKVRPVLENEEIILAEEGISGWFVTKNLRGPGKRYKYKKAQFSGCLVITKSRFISYTFFNRQINIPLDNPKLKKLNLKLLNATTLSISFESSEFRENWSGVIEFRFKTEKAAEFMQLIEKYANDL